MGQVVTAGVVAVVTAGLTQGALSALNVSSVGASTIGNNIATGNWAAAQSSLGSYLEGAVVHSAISAGVSTAAYGGSFGQAFANGMVQSAAALGANAIGSEIPGIGMANASASSIALNVAAHAALGCVASAAAGTGCGGGAIGGASSAIVAPLALGIIDPTHAELTAAQQGALAAIAGAAGGGLAAAFGQNALAGVAGAQNEALNNSGAHWGMTPSPLEESAEEERKIISHMNASAGLSRTEIVGYGPDGTPLTVLTIPPPMLGKGPTSNTPSTLYHYTNEAGMTGILESGVMKPSLKALNPNDVRYGNGQYLSSFVPGTMTPAQLSRAFINNPFQGSRFTNFFAIDVKGLNVVVGRPGVYVVPNEIPLNLNGRIIGSGRVTGK